MPAPPTAVINAIRAGTARRHLFFFLDHPGGPIRAWDGVGKFSFGGNEYLGVGGLASISGVGNSSDIQDHRVEVTLNQIPLAALSEVDQSIKGSAASITAVMIAENGEIIGSRVLFAGVGDYTKTKITKNEATVRAVIRGKMASWSAAPRAFYTDSDQQLRYPGDTGFSRMKELESATITGWNITPESSGANVRAWYRYLQDTVTGTVIGSATTGCLFERNSTPVFGQSTLLGSVLALLENTTGATNSTGNGDLLTFGGANPCYVDSSGDVRSPGGNLVYPTSYSSAAKLKRVAVIAAGSTTATTINLVASGYQYASGAYVGVFVPNGLSVTPGSGIWLNAIIDNCRGVIGHYPHSPWSGAIAAMGAVGSPDYSMGISNYVDRVTGNAVTVNGSNQLAVNGSPCVMSTTGAVLSSAGNLIQSNGTGAAGPNFLRVFS